MDAVREDGRAFQVWYSLPHARSSARIAVVTADNQMYLISVTRNERILETVTDET
jgi:hypothetical protein